MPPIKATIDIPDDLYRRVKARTAEEGRRIRDVTADLFLQWLDGERTPPATSGNPLVSPAQLSHFRDPDSLAQSLTARLPSQRPVDPGAPGSSAHQHQCHRQRLGGNGSAGTCRPCPPSLTPTSGCPSSSTAIPITGRAASPKLWMDAYLAAWAHAAGLAFVTFDQGSKNYQLRNLQLLKPE